MKRRIKYLVVAVTVVLCTNFASALDLNVFVAGDTIRASEVNHNFAELEAALEQHRTLSFPPKALSYSTGGGTFTDHNLGVEWTATYMGSGTLVIPQPADWDGTSEVVLDLYFYPLTAASGSVSFFIRPRGFDVGDRWSDASSMDSAPVPATELVLAKQTFSIPASSFGDADIWYITIQRGGTGETYADPVALTSVAITYKPEY